MVTLITGFTCPPTIYFKLITKRDKCYYKVRLVLQSVTILFQRATGITKRDSIPNSIIFKMLLGVFESGFLDTRTLMQSYNRFSHLFVIFNF